MRKAMDGDLLFADFVLWITSLDAEYCDDFTKVKLLTIVSKYDEERLANEE